VRPRMVRVCLWQRNEELLHTRTARKLRAPLQRIDTAVCHSSPSFLDDFEHKAGLNASSRRATWAWGCQYRKGVGASVSAANVLDKKTGSALFKRAKTLDGCHFHFESYQMGIWAPLPSPATTTLPCTLLRCQAFWQGVR